MRISDDGVGMEPDPFENGRANHWGMIHMQERAQKIGARLGMWSEKDRGDHPGTNTYLRSQKSIWRHFILTGLENKDHQVSMTGLDAFLGMSVAKPR
jgi:hypothetical protein